MANSISQGAIASIMAGATGANGYNPVVQVVSLKKMTQAQVGNERWRLVLSDGKHYAQSMLATQQNEMISSGELKELCIVKLTDYIVNVVQNKRLIILLKLEVCSGPTANIGNPVNFAEDPSSGNPQQQQQQQQGTNPYGGGAKPNTGGYGGGDVKPKVATNPYGAPRQAGNNPYSGGGGGGGNNNYGGGGGTRGGGASNPYANRSGGGGGNSGPVQRQSQDSVYVPISALNPYQNRWTIKARVTKKGDMRHWSNARGEGNLFSIDLLDEEGSEIKGTFFKADANKWIDQLEEGQVYSFSGGKVKVANKKFSSLNAEYEITFESSSQIILITDDNRIGNVMFTFTKLNEMEGLEANKILDVIAVVKGYEDCANITTRAGKETSKRNLTLVDDTCTEITMTLWGEMAKPSEGWDGNPVVAFKGVKLSDFGGRSLSLFNSSTIVHNPPHIAETADLRTWFDAAGGGSSFKSISVRGGGGSDEAAKRDVSARYTFDSIRESNLGHSEKGDWAVVKGTISFIKLDPEKDPWYTACPNDSCNKKVTETVEGGWQCEKCNQTHPQCQRRYMLNMTISDQTGKQWVTVFNDQAVPLLANKTADELHLMKEEGQEAEYEDIFTEACFKTYLMTIRIKADMVNDEMRIKHTVQRMNPIDLKTESQALLDAISKYN